MIRLAIVLSFLAVLFSPDSAVTRLNNREIHNSSYLVFRTVTVTAR